MVLSQNIEELEVSMNFYNEAFKRFGLTIANDKTKTITFNANEDVASTKSLIKIDNRPIENVRKFRYLGHNISNIDDTEHLDTQIGAAYQKYKEIKDVLMNKEIYAYFYSKCMCNPDYCTRYRRDGSMPEKLCGSTLYG